MSVTTMRKVLSCATATAFFMLAANANGAMLVSDTFTYSNGTLVGNDPPIGGAWAAHSAAGSTPVLVNSGTIGVAQGAGSREDVNVPFEGGYVLGADGVLYSGFDITVDDPGAAVQDANFAHFLTGTTAFDARVWVTAGAASGYRLALSNDNSITDGDGEVRSADLTFGTTYRVVTKYDFNGKSAMMWINPVDQSSPSVSATDPGFSDAAIAYAFRQAAGNSTQTIDNLDVSITFQGALAGIEVPEPATAGLMLLAILGLNAVRRRVG